MASKKGGEQVLIDRYTKAFFELAKEKNLLETVEKDLVVIEGLLAQSADFSRLMNSPLFSRQKKEEAVAAALKVLGISEFVVKFVELLARNSRLPLLPRIVESYRDSLSAHRGEITVQVVTTAPLKDAQAAAISEALKSALGRGVRLQSLVDPKILGGMVVKIGSTMLDSSVSAKLERLRAAAKNAASSVIN